MKKLMLTITMVILTVSAWGFGGRDQGERGNPMVRDLQKLNLTSEQKVALEAITKSSEKMEERKSHREQMATLHSELEKALESDASDERLLEIYKKINDSRTYIEEKRIRTQLAIRKILTKEQRKMWAELKKEHKKRFMKRGQKDRGSRNMKRNQFIDE